MLTFPLLHNAKMNQKDTVTATSDVTAEGNIKVSKLFGGKSHRV